MKKIIALVMAAVMILSMTVYGTAAPENVTLINDAKYDMDAQALLEATGMSLSELEAIADDIRYNGIALSTDPIAEAEFVINGYHMRLRVKPILEVRLEEAEDISGLYYEWKEVRETEVSYCSAILRSCDNITSVLWLNIVPGILYSLSSEDNVPMEEMNEIAAAVFEVLYCGESGPIGLINDAEYDMSADAQCEATGQNLSGLERIAEDVRYNGIALSTEPIAEAEFTINGYKMCLRVKPVSEVSLNETEDISGLYYEWKEIREAEVSYCSAILRSCDNMTSIVWLNVVPGILYSLSSGDSVPVEEMNEIADSVFAVLFDGEFGAVGMINYAKYDIGAEEQLEETGIRLNGLETIADDVRYNVLGLHATPMADIQFTYNGHLLYLRAVPTDTVLVEEAEDISGFYYGWTDTTGFEADSCKGILRTCDYAASALWLDVVPGLLYSLSSDDAISAEEMIQTVQTVFAAAKTA